MTVHDKNKSELSVDENCDHTLDSLSNEDAIVLW